MAPAVYRLFTFIEWENIPEEYQKFYPKEAKETWNDDLNTFNQEHLILDIETEIKAVFKGLFKRSITQAMSIIPIILADVYMTGKSTNKLEAQYHKVIREYIEYYDVDKVLADKLAITDITKLIQNIADTAHIDLGFKIEEMYHNIIEEFEEKVKKSVVPLNIEDLVDKALAEHDKHEKEKV